MTNRESKPSELERIKEIMTRPLTKNDLQQILAGTIAVGSFIGTIVYGHHLGQNADPAILFGGPVISGLSWGYVLAVEEIKAGIPIYY